MAQTMEKGFVPFGLKVKPDNSVNLLYSMKIPDC